METGRSSVGTSLGSLSIPDLLTTIVAQSFGLEWPSPEALQKGKIGFINGILESRGVPPLSQAQIEATEPLTSQQIEALG